MTLSTATVTVSTPERLAAVLDDAGLSDMAAAARTGLYDEWRSELTHPRNRLVAELRARGQHVLADRAAAREFDPTTDETLDWLASDHARTCLGQMDAGAYDPLLLLLARSGMRLPADMMHALVARHVAVCTAQPWVPDPGCLWTADMADDAVHAVWHLVRQSGGRAFRFGHHGGHTGPVWAARWHASAVYDAGRRVGVDIARSPAEAADMLAGLILLGARCAGCNRPTTMDRAAGACRWRRHGPRWVGACGTGL